MATEKRLKGIPNKCDDCVYITACQRACVIFNYPFYDFMIRSASCGAYEPKVETVEVVRCKDCKLAFHNLFFDDVGKQVICRKWANNHLVNGDDFCSYGERKDYD